MKVRNTTGCVCFIFAFNTKKGYKRQPQTLRHQSKSVAGETSSSSSSFRAFIHLTTLSSSTYKKYIYLEFVIGFGFMNEKSFSLLNAHKTEKNFILCI